MEPQGRRGGRRGREERPKRGHGWQSSEVSCPSNADRAYGSFVDILYLGRIFPKHAAIMAKKSIKWIPGLGWFSGFIHLPYADPSDDVRNGVYQSGKQQIRHCKHATGW